MDSSENIYDMAVVGGGPAGYTAALYGAMTGLRVVVLEMLGAGGQMAQAAQIDNYPGYTQGVDGYELGQRMQQGAERFGAETKRAQVQRLALTGTPKRIECDCGSIYARSVVVATGAHPKTMGLEGEREMLGSGVSYCASCDGHLYRDKSVAVLGGGNSAATEALHLSDMCRQVYLLHRGERLSAEAHLQHQLRARQNVELLLGAKAEAVLYTQKVTGLRYVNLSSGACSEIALNGVFIAAGRSPATQLLEGQLNLDAQGYIMAGESTQTAIPGVFAAGDVRTKPLRQVVTAIADGAVAAKYAAAFLRSAAEKGSDLDDVKEAMSLTDAHV